MKGITLDAVRTLIEEKTGKEITITGQSGLIGFVDKGTIVTNFYFDVDDEEVVFTTTGEKAYTKLHCVLFQDELVEGMLSIEGVKNGILVINGETLNEQELARLVELQV